MKVLKLRARMYNAPELSYEAMQYDTVEEAAEHLGADLCLSYLNDHVKDHAQTAARMAVRHGLTGE